MKFNAQSIFDISISLPCSVCVLETLSFGAISIFRILILSQHLQDDEGRRSVQQDHRMETEFDEEGEDEESDADDFIVDDDGRPITEKKKKVNFPLAHH